MTTRAKESPSPDQQRCPKCHGLVIFAVAGRMGRAPFDAVPVRMAVPRERTPLAETPNYLRVVDVREVYTPHVQTCASASEHRGHAGYVAGNED